MRKIKLDLSALAVGSFNTGAETQGGTVHGQHEDPTCGCGTGEFCYATCWSCPGQNTCVATCPYTCDDATCQSCPAGACGGDLSAAHGTCYNCNTGEPQESDAGCATLTT